MFPFYLWNTTLFSFVLLAAASVCPLVSAAPVYAAPSSAGPVTTVILYPPARSVVISQLQNSVVSRNSIVVEPLSRNILPDTLKVLSPDYRLYSFENYNVSYPDLLKRNVGRDIELLSERQTVKGRLVMAEEGTVIVQTPDGLLLNPGGEIRVPESNNDVMARLRIELTKPQRSVERVSLYYELASLSSGIQYQLQLDDAQSKAALEGLLTVRNSDVLPVRSANLKVMVGYNQPNQPPQFAYAAKSVRMMESDMNAGPSAVDEMYEYTLGGEYDLMPNATAVLPFIPKKEITVTKEYRFRPVGYDWVDDSTKEFSPVESVLHFKNTTGLPLASGPVQVYVRQRLVGQANLSYTAPDEPVHMVYTRSFEIKGQKLRLDRRETSTVNRESYRVTLRNLKSEDVAVTVLDTLSGGGWDVASFTGGTWEKATADQLRYVVTVPAGKTAVLEYVLERTRYPLKK